MGSAVEMVADSRKKRGPVDVLLSCCASFPEAINFGLPHYAFTLPFGQLQAVVGGPRQSITLGVDGVAAACEAAEARYFLPYAHGFRGLGEDPSSPEAGLSESEMLAQLRPRLGATSTHAWRPDAMASFAAGTMTVREHDPHAAGP